MPGSPLDGKIGTVAERTPWGAHVKTASAAAGEVRAAYSEMEELGEFTGECCSFCGGVSVRRCGVCSVCENCGTTSGCS